MKKIILLLVILTMTFAISAQSNYSPCYTNNMSKGNTAFSQGKYSEARTYYVNAKQCAGGNPSAAQQKINACDAKIKAQKEAAEAKQRAEAEAIEAKKRAEQEAAEAKRKAEEAEARRKAEAEAAEARRKAEAEEAEKERFQKLKSKSSYSNGFLTIDGVVYKMIYVKGGTFTMGRTSEQGDDSKGVCAHSVTLSNFCIGETEVTQKLWEAVMGNNPSRFNGDDLPVEHVSWNDCQEFIKKLNLLTGKTFRLPTEAEWEYAARGGNKSKGYKFAGGNAIGDVAWYKVNCYDKGYSCPDYGTHPVKGKRPNELGLYDMSGNVDEWCQDWWSLPGSSSQTNPTGPSWGTDRVFRGGSRMSPANICRVADRKYEKPDRGWGDIGFRLAIDP